jgi:hypothetical protein
MKGTTMIPPFDMSMDARMVLAKMSNIFERERGTRVELSRDDDVVGLVNHGWETLNHEYLRLFERFCALLSADEIRELKARGAQIYRGAEVTGRNDEPPQAGANTVVYRGSVINGGVEQGPDQNAAENTHGAKRVYRGRFVED